MFQGLHVHVHAHAHAHLYSYMAGQHRKLQGLGRGGVRADHLRGEMAKEERLLVGVDLRKSREVLEPAYDDAAGVTAKFNRNVLARVNRELGGNFDLQGFDHLAHYNEEEGRIEMHLVSVRDQKVTIEDLGLDVDFMKGERIHTENSYKYSLEEIDLLAKNADLRVEGQWFDQNQRFSLNLMAGQ